MDDDVIAMQAIVASVQAAIAKAPPLHRMTREEATHLRDLIESVAPLRLRIAELLAESAATDAEVLHLLRSPEGRA